MARPRTPAPVSQAERWRAHREEMELAQQLGCTPKEARAELDRRRAIERHRRHPLPIPTTLQKGARTNG